MNSSSSRVIFLYGLYQFNYLIYSVLCYSLLQISVCANSYICFSNYGDMGKQLKDLTLKNISS